MIIDHTYFSQKLSLPQIGNSEGRELVIDFIGIYEEEYLKKALCYDLWKAFSEGIAGSPGGYEQRWIDLLEGKEFTYLSKNYKWDGFETILKTPIANYVYYKWMEDQAYSNTLSGTATQVVDNNSRVNAIQKMVDAWNKMVDMNNTLWMFLKANEVDYPEWIDCELSEIFYKQNSMDL